GGDCNDTLSAIHPDAIDVCDGLDNNCDGVIDELSLNANITATGSTTFCSGSFVTLEANTGVGYSFKWFINGNLISGATTAQYDAVESGIFSCEISGPGGCIDTSNSITVTALVAPVATITTPDGLNLCVDPTIRLKASKGTGYKYRWYKNETQMTGTSAKKSDYTATTTGLYKCQVTHSNGCTEFTPEVNVINTCRNIEINESSQCIIYPNPNEGIFTIRLEEVGLTNRVIEIYIINSNGTLVHRQMVVAEDDVMELNMNSVSLPGGIYFLRVVAQKTYSQTFIILKD
ncbi:MAG: MopE-related protein, partial [Chitinophagales bacterium]